MMLLFFILAAMTSLAPGRDHIATATAIADVVLSEPPLFKHDESRVRTAAFITAVAFRESSFRNEVVSKTGDSCLMQINHRPDLASDPRECVRVAFTMLRESFRMCREYPLAFYASGPRGCSNARAQRISRDRFALAARLEKYAPPPVEEIQALSRVE